MPIDGAPYQDQTIAFGTIHGKEQAVAKTFGRQLAASIVVPEAIDTDSLGTFTGEIPRAGTMAEAARSKALLAMQATGAHYGLGSEGSFGPHPHIPLIPCDTELLLFIDQVNDSEVCESLVTHRTNYQSCTCTPGDDIAGFLTSIRFPRHAVVVAPRAAPTKKIPQKGISSVTGLTAAILRASRESSDRAVQIDTVMRANFNPTRMGVIRALAHRLARRLATRCPQCGTPGFGVVDIARGLPCGWCGKPTHLAISRIYRCAKCALEMRRGIDRVPSTADPASCEHCNP